MTTPMTTPDHDESHVPTTPVYMRRKDAAAYLKSKYGIGSPILLAMGAMNGTGPLFRKLGPRVFYEVKELDRWMQERLSEPMRSTSDRLHPDQKRSGGRPPKPAPAPSGEPADWQPDASASDSVEA